MALVKCPECGSQVSTGAASCPHCGMVLPRGPADTTAPGSGFVFAQGAAAAVPEKTLWEGSPSLALVYGKILGIVLWAIILYVIAYLLVDYALPAISTLSPDVKSLIEQNGSTAAWLIYGIFTILLIPPIASLVSVIAKLRNTHYKVTSQRIIVERGVLSRALEEIDMRSIDDTEFRQSFMERMFKIGEIWVVSTDKIAPKMVLHGVPDPRSTRELIRSTAYEASQRQLFTRST